PHVAKPKQAPALLTRRGPLAPGPKIAGKGAILVDARSGEVLWAKAPHRRLAVASTTKIMTAVVALEHVRAHDVVTIAPSVPRVRTKTKRVAWAAPTYSKIYVNKNHLLGSYPGVDGVKTGWTTAAKHCLVISAMRHGIHLIAVVIGSPDAYTDMKRVLDYGFA